MSIYPLLVQSRQLQQRELDGRGVAGRVAAQGYICLRKLLIEFLRREAELYPCCCGGHPINNLLPRASVPALAVPRKALRLSGFSFPATHGPIVHAM